MTRAKKSRPAPLLRARFDVMGAGHDVYSAITAILGACAPEIIGWCEIDLDGATRAGLVVSQAWPRALPFGVDPIPIIKSKRYVAVVPMGDRFRVVEIAAPGMTKSEVTP